MSVEEEKIFMKKVIALVLALCMVFAMSTAAFAVTGKI